MVFGVLGEVLDPLNDRPQVVGCPSATLLSLRQDHRVEAGARQDAVARKVTLDATGDPSCDWPQMIAADAAPSNIISTDRTAREPPTTRPVFSTLITRSTIVRSV